MNVTEALLTRASIRAYRPDPVDGPRVAEILEPALRSPSWANSQPWEVFVAGGEPVERLRAGSLERTGEEWRADLSCRPRRLGRRTPRRGPRR